jgi:acyl carrier protein
MTVSSGVEAGGAQAGQGGDKAAILSRLNDIFQDVITDDVELTPDTTAKAVPEWDSLSHIRLILAVERAFKVKFSAAEVSRLTKAGDLVDLIDARTR